MGARNSSGVQQQSNDAPFPRLVTPDWNHGRMFAPAEDVDRTKEPHERVVFNATAPRSVTVEHLYTGTDGGASFATVLHNVLSPEECLAWIDMANKKGFTPALINVGGGYQKYLPEVRDHSRCIIDDEVLADFLFQVLKPYLPATVPGRQLYNLNERLRFLCYHEPGQKFDAHLDAHFELPRPHPRAGDKSFVTVQLYLNEDFVGGETTFCFGEPIPYKPKRGSVLIFSQNLMHEGSAVESGLKYTVRTEAMYARNEQPPQPPVDTTPIPLGYSDA